ESQRFRHSIVHRTLALDHFRPLLQQFFDLRMDMEIRWIAAEPPTDFTQLFQRQARSNAVLFFVAPANVVVPIGWQVAHQRLLLYGFCGFLSGLKLRANRLDAGFGVGGASTLSIDFPQGWMVFDGLIQERLGDGRIVHLAVAVAAITDKIYDNVAGKSVAVLKGQAPYADNRIHVLGIHMK